MTESFTASELGMFAKKLSNSEFKFAKKILKNSQNFRKTNEKCDTSANFKITLQMGPNFVEFTNAFDIILIRLKMADI